MHYLIILAIGIPVAAIVIRIAISIASMKGNKVRAEKLRRIAETMNLSFEEKGDSVLESSLSGMRLFLGHRFPCIRNVMKGSVGDADMTVMDYEYTTGSPGSAGGKTYVSTVIEFRSSLLRLPSFTLTPRGWLLNIASSFGAPDIVFDSHPSFSRQSMLFGTDEKSIRSIFSSDILDFYEQRGEWSTSGDGNRLLICKASSRIPEEGMRSFVQEGLGLYLLFKSASERDA